MAASDLLGESSAAAPLPELEALGTSLRTAREAQGLTLPELAARLNMGCEQLEALEAGNREKLREAVFVIAQARRVAGSLGVSVDSQIEALRHNPAFQQAPPQAKPVPAAAARTQSPASPAAPSPRRVVPGLLVALAAAAGVVAILVAHQRGAFRLALPALPETAKPAPSTAQPASASKDIQPAKAPANTLVLSSRGRSWMEVTTAGGTTLFRGTLEGTKSFPLGQGLRVLAGRPDLVSAQLGDGPARVLGPIDQVVWRRFPATVKAP